MELLESRVATLSDENAQLQEETRRLALELKEKDVIRGRRGSPESATTSSTESERTDQLFTSLMAQLKESMERASVTLEVQAVRANALPDLTKFRGESPADSQVLAKHIAIFRMKYPLSAFSEEERCILFEASLEGKPLSVFRSAPESTLEGKLVYLKEAIKGHEGVALWKAGEQFEALRMKEGPGRVKHFCSEIERLHKLLYPKMTDEDSSYSLTTRLFKEVRDWPNAETMIARIAVLPRAQSYSELKGWALLHTNPRSGVRQRERRPWLPPTSDGPPAQPPMKQVKCFQCNEVGHVKRACPKLKVAAVRATVSENSQEIPLKIGGSWLEEVALMEQRMKAVVDSGAQLTILPSWLLKTANAKEWMKNYSDTPTIQLRSVDLSTLKVEKVEICLRRSNRKARVSVAFMETPQAILGSNAFAALGIQMCLEGDLARIQERCVIPPGCSKMVTIRGAAKRAPFFSEEPAIPSTVGAPAGETLEIPVHNTGIEPLLFKKSQVVGSFLEEEPSEDLVCQRVQLSDEVESSDTTEQLKKMVETVDSSIIDQDKVRRLLKDHESLFTMGDKDLQTMLVPPAPIDTGDAAPIAQRVRPVSLAVQRELGAILDDMESSGITERSSSSWASPLVLVRKQDGSLRVCVDYRALIKVLRKDKYPLPNAELTLQRLAGFSVFSSIDCFQGFFQIPLERSAREKSAFVTHKGLYQFKRLPFGLSNSPSVFQRSMDFILSHSKLWGKEVHTYVDDVIISTTTVERHVEVLGEVFQLFKRFRVSLKPTKCKLFKTELRFLGHIVSVKGLRTDPEKVRAITEYPVPANLADLRTFLGMISYHRRFILHFAVISKPLYALTSTKKEWDFNGECLQAFNELKRKMSSTPVLHQPDIEGARDGSRPMILYTDASLKGTGAVLTQKQQDELYHPIAFTSRGLTEHEVRYAITDLEALAIVHACERFHGFIYGVRVIVRTDHLPLLSLFANSQTSNRVLRWAIKLRTYDLQIEYIKGPANRVADGLSRGPVNCREQIPEKEFRFTEEVVIGRVRLEQEEQDEWVSALRADSDFSTLLERMDEPKETVIRLGGKRFQLKEFVVRHEKLYHVTPNGKELLVVPVSQREKLIADTHGGIWAGHLGPDKLLKQLREKYFWLGMGPDIIGWHKKCLSCYLNNYKSPNVPPLNPILVTKPFDTVGMDIVELRVSRRGNRYGLVVVDYFSKWAEIYPLPNKSAELCVKTFLTGWIGYGARLPTRIISDNGLEFDNKYFKALCDLLQITWCPSKAYNPRENGLAERTHQTIVGMLRKSDCARSDWDTRLPLILYGYNTAVHERTGFSPYELLYGTTPRLFSDFFSESHFQLIDLDAYLSELKEVLSRSHKVAIGHAQKQAEIMKSSYDAKNKVLSSHHFRKGEEVFVKILNELGAQRKLGLPYKGPFTVKDVAKTSVLLDLNKNPTWVQSDLVVPSNGQNVNIPQKLAQGRRIRGRPKK